jgi:anti-anti-sigma factor
MLLELAQEWTVDIDRGPDWLFVKLRPPHDDAGEIPLAEMVWNQLEQCFCHRVVLEMEEVPHLRSWMVGELVRLQKRVASSGGMLRIAGLSQPNYDVLRICRLADRFPNYRNRTDAVMGYRPPQPR